jgi:hypothetical protein
VTHVSRLRGLAPKLLLVVAVCAVPFFSLLAHFPQLPAAYLRIFAGMLGGAAQMYMESVYLPPVTTGP